MMITLGIETSCDETAAAVVKDAKILSNSVSSSVHLHARYGGVVPEIASRFHLEYINFVVKKALRDAGISLKDIELVAYTSEPGLPGSLLIGVSYARALSYALAVPALEVNHLDAHIFVNFLRTKRRRIKKMNVPGFPFIGLVISGGHTNIFLCRSLRDFQLLGQTRDDAVGEAFDKVAKILDLGYPGGPIIEKRARRFRGKETVDFPRVFLGKDSVDFSFSGVKTAVYYAVRNKKLSRKDVDRIAFSFQESVFDVLLEKALLACRKFGIKDLVVGGGVSSNKTFQRKLVNACKRPGIKVHIPERKLCLDNAAMVAGMAEAIYGGTGS